MSNGTGADILYGQEGDDVIKGGGGPDTLYGGTVHTKSKRIASQCICVYIFNLTILNNVSSFREFLVLQVSETTA